MYFYIIKCFHDIQFKSQELWLGACNAIYYIIHYLFHLRILWHFSCAPPYRKRTPDTRCRRLIWKLDKRACKWGIAATLLPRTPSAIRRCSASFLWGTIVASNGTRPSLVSPKVHRFPPYRSPRSAIRPIAARPSRKHESSIGGLFSYPSYYQFIFLCLSFSLASRDDKFSVVVKSWTLPEILRRSSDWHDESSCNKKKKKTEIIWEISLTRVSGAAANAI